MYSEFEGFQAEGERSDHEVAVAYNKLHVGNSDKVCMKRSPSQQETFPWLLPRSRRRPGISLGRGELERKLMCLN